MGCLDGLLELIFNIDGLLEVIIYCFGNALLRFFFPWGRQKETVNVLPYLILATLCGVIGSWYWITMIVHTSFDGAYLTARCLAFCGSGYFGLVTLAFWP